MENRKSFIKGLVVGVLLLVLLNMSLKLFNSITGYAITNDMSVDKKIERIYDVLDKNYVDEITEEDKEKMENYMYMGLVAGLGDPYSVYMNPDAFKSFIESSEGTYYGIGAVVAPSDDNKVLVINPYEGAPGYEAGLRSGDKIVAVNGVDVYGNALDEAVSLMKGPKGTTVNLTIEKVGTRNIEEIEVTRDEIIVPTIEYELMEDNIGYIKISTFDRVTEEQFNEAYDDLLSQGIEGLIIDVRNNPGGLLSVVGEITDRLIPEGFVTYTEDKEGNQDYIYSDDEEIEIPLVVLVNGNSASASEILSGAIKDTGKGILVGEQTFGKGLVQNIFMLPDGSAVKTTIARYYTPNGICIQGEGIEPDYVVEMSDEDTANLASLTYEEDVQLQKAVEVLKNEMDK